MGSFDTFPGTSSDYDGNWGVDLSLGLKRVFLSDRTRGLIVVDASGVVIPGDYNQDMVVNYADYDVWRAAFGTTPTNVHDAAYGDGNYDGIVDARDYVVWRDHFGQVQSGIGSNSWYSEAAVPEPSSSLLLSLGLGVVSMCRRVRCRC